MVKFSDAIFQDAYLCSLRRQHDDDNVLPSTTYQSTTNASKVANSRDREYGEKRDNIQEEREYRYQEDIYTSTTFKSGSNKHNQYHDTNNNKYNKQQSSVNYNKHITLSSPPPPTRYTNKEEVEEYITKSPIIQRSKQRQIERNSFLDWADSQLGYKATSTTSTNKDAGNIDGGAEEGGGASKDDREVRDGGKSTRMKKLWDFNNIDTSYVKGEDREDEQRDDDNNDNISTYKPTSSIRDPSSTKTNSATNNLTNSKSKKEIWTASKIRQESRQDITKQLNNDLYEIEIFMSSMKKRIKMYGTDSGGKEGRVAADDARKLGDADVRDKNTEGKGAADNELHLNSSSPSSSESIPLDDGYGKQVRSPHHTNTSHKSLNGNREINHLIHKFQSTRIKQSRHYLVQGDELMNCNTANDDKQKEKSAYNEPPMTKEKQAIKIATYTGINQQQDDITTKKVNGSSRRAAKKNRYDYTISSPREVRLKRMQELKKKHQLVIIDEDRKNEPPPPPPPKEDKEQNVKTDIDSWWDEHKLKQDERQQRYDKDQGCLDTNYNIDDELERWWKEKRRHDTPNKTTFAELEEEPTIHDDRVTFISSTTIKGTPALPPLSPMNTIPTKKAEGSTSNSKSKPNVKSHLSPNFRARPLGSPLPIQRESGSSIDGPLLPSTSSESSALTDENIDREVEHTNNDEVEEQSVSSSSLSILSEEEEEDRCQSLAQSTLSILLSRIDEAKASFIQALLDGDAVKQAELASLLSRLGEAAVTMKKLEQTA